MKNYPILKHPDNLKFGEFNHFSSDTAHNIVWNYYKPSHYSDVSKKIIDVQYLKLVESGGPVNVMEDLYITRTADSKGFCFTISVLLDNKLFPIIATYGVYEEKYADDEWKKITKSEKTSILFKCVKRRPKAPFICDVKYDFDYYTWCFMYTLSHGELSEPTGEIFKEFAIREFDTYFKTKNS